MEPRGIAPDAGDLDYFYKCLHLAHYGSNTPCVFCPVNTTDNPWSNFNVNAPWLGQLYTSNDWPYGEGGPFSLDGVSLHTVHADYMHCKLLGTDQYIFGSVLWLLIYGQERPIQQASQRMQACGEVVKKPT